MAAVEAIPGGQAVRCFINCPIASQKWRPLLDVRGAMAKIVASTSCLVGSMKWS